MDFSGIVKSPQSIAELFRHARAEHIYLPHPDFDRRTTYRQWSDKHAAFAYDTVPERYRAVFPRSWQETWVALKRSNLSVAKARFRSRVFIGQYVLAFSRLTGTDVRSSCRFLLEGGFATVFRHQMNEDVLSVDGAAGWHFRRLVEWAELDPVNAESLRLLAYEADVPDPRSFFTSEWGSAAECAAAARTDPQLGIPSSRFAAKRWLAKGYGITAEHRAILAVRLTEAAYTACERRNSGVSSPDEYLSGVAFWSSYLGKPRKG